MVQFRLIVTRSPFQSSIFHDGQSEPIGVTPLTGIYIWELPLVRQRANSVALGPRSVRIALAPLSQSPIMPIGIYGANPNPAEIARGFSARQNAGGYTMESMSYAIVGRLMT